MTPLNMTFWSRKILIVFSCKTYFYCIIFFIYREYWFYTEYWKHFQSLSVLKTFVLLIFLWNHSFFYSSLMKSKFKTHYLFEIEILYLKCIWYMQSSPAYLMLNNSQAFFLSGWDHHQGIMHLNTTIDASGHTGFFSAGSIVAKDSGVARPYGGARRRWSGSFYQVP